MADDKIQGEYVPAKRRRKVSKACVFCRRSHMICDDQRPCSRCIKRDIGHLCQSEKVHAIISTPSGVNGIDINEIQSQATSKAEQNFDVQAVPDHLLPTLPAQYQPVNKTGNNMLSQNPKFVSEHVGSEFSSLNEFLTMLEDPMLMEPTPSPAPAPTTTTSASDGQVQPQVVPRIRSSGLNIMTKISEGMQLAQEQPTAKENFFLTAADPSTEVDPEDRLKLVINAKLEAGLLQPYNYSQGYSRLQSYMDKYMNHSSRQRILKPLSTIRPAFRAIARSLKDVDLVLVEESFERMLLSYDRVFTSMSMPACLWRRTGEIYRGNKEFASLVGCTVDDLRDGKIAIYELMTEESAVNFWEKYGSIAFDKGQKAVLTSCNLRSKDGRRRRPCCFSFTIRRDRYNIPICIVGNFIPIS